MTTQPDDAEWTEPAEALMALARLLGRLAARQESNRLGDANELDLPASTAEDDRDD